MRNVRRLLHADVIASVCFVALAFLALFFFLDFVEELRKVGRGSYTLLDALVSCLLEVPGHLYELAPIAVLIGSIYALSRLAQSSEFTILRTSGLGPGRALLMLAQVGLAFTLITFLVGDVVAPITERQGAQLQATQAGGYGLGRGGAWLKERRQGEHGPISVSVNVAAATGDGQLHGIRIFEFDADGRLVTRIGAKTARIARDGHWTLLGVERIEWPRADAGTDASPGAASARVTPGAPASPPPPRVLRESLESLDWQTSLQAGVVAAAVMPEKTMSTLELFRYIGHLSRNEQAAQSHEIAFWRRALYPFACLVMVALALPFAYLHARAGGISLKVFGGIMLGIGFVLLNNVAAHLGLLRNWTPWIVASTPSLLFLGLSLVAFAWLVRFR